MSYSKLSEILAIIFVIFIIASSMGCIYNLNKEIKCPNCNSTNVNIINSDSPVDKEDLCECLNCGAYFYSPGNIMGYNGTINKKYNETHNLTN